MYPLNVVDPETNTVWLPERPAKKSKYEALYKIGTVVSWVIIVILVGVIVVQALVRAPGSVESRGRLGVESNWSLEATFGR